jgi:hypothetical protein
MKKLFYYYSSLAMGGSATECCKNKYGGAIV